MKIEAIANQYEGFHAEFYDIMHTDLTDLPFYLEQCQIANGPVLEIGSGTGRLLLPIRKNGIDITGIEPFEQMLKISLQKMRSESIDCPIIHSTAQEFSSEKKFDLAFIACNTFQHFITLDDQKAALNNIRRHLAKNGRLLIDLSVPDVEVMTASNGKTEVFEFKHPSTGTLIKDQFTAKYDFINQVESDHIVLEEFDGDTCLRKATADVTMTFFFPRELILMVENCGFSLANTWKDYACNPFDSKANTIIVEAING